MASRKPKNLGPPSPAAAEFIILATSLPTDGYPAEQVLAANRFRWQSELAFKRSKSCLHFHKLPAQAGPGARIWRYAHLILALLCDDVSQGLLESFPSGLVLRPMICRRRCRQRRKSPLSAVAEAIRGPVSLHALRDTGAAAHRSFANARRTRKPHVIYGTRSLL
jgi:hypothetical protein